MKPTQREGADEGRGLPVAVRNADPEALAPEAAPVPARHVGLGPGLVDEHQARGVEIELPLEPGLAPAHDVGTALLAGMGGLFLRVMLVPPEEALQRAEAEYETLLGQNVAHLLERPVAVGAPRRQNGHPRVLSMRWDLRSPPRAFGRASPCSRSRALHRLTLAALTPKRSPAARCVIPSATAARTRTRRSSDNAFDMPAGLQPGSHSESPHKRFGNPDSIRPGSALACA